MTGTEIAFFAASATIIPVLLVAYVLGVNKMTQALGQRYFKSFGEYSQRVDEALSSREGRAKNTVRAVVAFFAAIVYQIGVLSLFTAAVALPSFGEYEALHALYADQTSSFARAASFYGALTAGAVVIAPLALTALRMQFPLTLFSRTAAPHDDNPGDPSPRSIEHRAPN
jgi:hypothetical protein